MSASFYQIFIFNQIIALQKLWKIFFISSKKLFSFSRYSNSCISVLPSFLLVSHCFRDWSKINLKILKVTKQVQKKYYLLPDQVWWCNIKQFLSYFKKYTSRFMQDNLWDHKLFHFLSSFLSGKCGKGGKKLQTFEYLKNEKNFLKN